MFSTGLGASSITSCIITNTSHCSRDLAGNHLHVFPQLGCVHPQLLQLPPDLILTLPPTTAALRRLLVAVPGSLGKLFLLVPAERVTC